MTNKQALEQLARHDQKVRHCLGLARCGRITYEEALEHLVIHFANKSDPQQALIDQAVGVL